ncbi:uncharacterized protein RCC_08673 [Ramularia collo-cygni]|uniref:GH16 domain-containing protein n=1 Tax=Ramularia collo-cygni TaxID=112498 RepID=A0A2D3VBC8_9PEZI|nr:uncharacterized protein RCC_08673 [Ramularia collo-cygni]CZT22965.1 uncharacterized protein RCC_08673 [Ramularia collo-cygni]
MAKKVSDCDCGFIDADEPTHTTFTSLLLVDFTKATWKDLDDIFVRSSYTVNRTDAAYIRDFEPSQIQLTSSGLELTVSPSPDGLIVPSASIFTRSAAFLHGSYRARILVGDVPGTVTAFYNYHNDTSEVDIEYVSARGPTLLYSVKPQIYYENTNPSAETYQSETWGNDTSSTSSSLSFEQNFHEWSFTWLPDIVHFGLDANYSKSITKNVPQAPGTIVLSHWSNGNPKYSQGPPTVKSTKVVEFLQAVYNDANATALECKKVQEACVIQDGRLRVALGMEETDGGVLSGGGGGGSSSSASASGSTAAAAAAASSFSTLPAVSHVNSATTAGGTASLSPGVVGLWTLILLFFLR